MPRYSHGGDRLGLVAATSSGVIGFGWANPDGSDYVQLDIPDPTLNLGCVAWSPDDTRVACEGWDDADPSRNGIYTIRTSDGQDLVRVTTAPDGLHDLPGDFSPDGQQIYFNRIDPDGEGRGALMVVRPDGSDEHQLTDLFVGGARLSPDGTTLLTDDDSQLVLVTVASGDSHAIQLETESTVYPFSAAWSPDGSRIVFSLGISNRGWDLYTARADGSDLVQITDSPDVKEEFADWSSTP